jgi:BirA family biotin operon repressor/biotin-[acetyl-CoA-carboxylase] ligase
VASAWTDLDRPPLSASRLGQVADGRPWREIRVVAATASTNADLAAEARSGAAPGLVLFAEQQTAGRGRLDRSWDAPPRAALLVSVLLRPGVAAAALPLLPLLAGVAVVETVRSVARLHAVLKWPNDVLVEGRKVAGVLLERVEDAVVVGVGLNVSTRPTELPVETATSLAIAGGGTDRESLAKELLRALGRRYLAFCDAGGSPDSVLPAYREVCDTIGRRVEVRLPVGEPVRGLARAVDDDGMLVVVEDDGTQRRWSAADVVHLRAAG